jgi:hypothetical protein
MLAVAETEQELAYNTLVAAFAEDPVERWLYPELHEYRSHFPQFLAAFGGMAFAAQTVWRLGDFAAVAPWMPPGVEPDADAIIAVLSATVVAAKHSDTFAVLEQMDAAYQRDPHLVLGVAGRGPRTTGKGLGGRLLAECIDLVDASHLPPYLETPNPRTVPLYERHGFEFRRHCPGE